jgi:GT2 family glycosyltransferase
VNEPIVDIIIPVYNQIDLVVQCVESIITSKNSQRYQIIIIDDASPDPNVGSGLDRLATRFPIELHTNSKNVGFTKTVNFGMALHKDRDVLLLNSDTIVYGSWIDKISRAAKLSPDIATVNPLTNQYGSHVSCYPERVSTTKEELNIDHSTLSEICSEVNDGKLTYVHTTIGFCMYIKRKCINDIGYFDSVNFPVGYGEECDFCFRASKVGWRHVVVGDAFVTHLDGQSFNEKKSKLMSDMIPVFLKLHPELTLVDRVFAQTDPLRNLRAGVDVGRLQQMARNATEIRVYDGDKMATCAVQRDTVHLVYSSSSKHIKFGFASASTRLPNLSAFQIPIELPKFNSILATLQIDKIVCVDEGCFNAVGLAAVGLPVEVTLEPKLVLRRLPVDRQITSAPALL